MIRFLRTALISITMIAVGLCPKASQSQDASTPLTFVIVIDISGSMDDRLPAPVQARLTDSTKLMDVVRQLNLLADHLPMGTHVIVTVFDHEAKEVCDIRLDSPDARLKLQQHFASIKSRNGSTFLWRTVDAELGRAAKIAASNPEQRVRMLLYSDGEDMEKASGLDYTTIIKKYGKVLQSDVRLNFVTLGFDLKAEISQAFQKSGVVVSKAVTADDVAPLIAGFTLSPPKLHVGENVSLLDESVGVGITQRYVDWGDKSPFEQGDLLQHQYKAPGTYTVRYVVMTSTGRKNQANARIVVTTPERQTPQIRLSSRRVRVGEKIRIEDVTVGDARSRKWLASNGESSTSEIFETSFNEPGKGSVELTRIDGFGQEEQVTESIDVELPPALPSTFRIATQPTRIGDVVVLINESSESALQFVWKDNEVEFSRERHATLSVTEYGTHNISLTVVDQYGQSQVSYKTFELPRPAAPIVDFELPPSVKIGEPATLACQLSGEIDAEPTWYLDGETMGSGRTVTIAVTSPGEHHVRVIATGPGGQAVQEKTLVVPPPVAPKAGFTVGNPNPFVGDVIRITDTSTGPIDRIHFDVLGLNAPQTIEIMNPQENRTFDVECSRIGELTVVQRVFGPGGQDVNRSTISVASRSINPTADFDVRLDPERGRIVAKFLNKSQGTFERMVFDAGDGTDTREVAIDEEILHTYGVGTWTPRITVHGPSRENLLPSTWIGQEIQVAEPMATWVRNLAWQVPGGLTLGAASLAAMGLLRKRRLRDRKKRISGHLVIRPVNKPRGVKQIEFGGENYEEVIELDATSTLRISTRDDGFLHHQAELVRNGQTVQVVDLDDLANVKLGNYLISYAA